MKLSFTPLFSAVVLATVSFNNVNAQDNLSTNVTNVEVNNVNIKDSVSNSQSKATSNEVNSLAENKDAKPETSQSVSVQEIVRVSQRVEDFSVEILEPNVRKHKSDPNEYTVLHAQAQYNIEVPDSEVSATEDPSLKTSSDSNPIVVTSDEHTIVTADFNTSEDNSKTEDLTITDSKDKMAQVIAAAKEKSAPQGETDVVVANIYNDVLASDIEVKDTNNKEVTQKESTSKESVESKENIANNAETLELKQELKNKETDANKLETNDNVSEQLISQNDIQSEHSNNSDEVVATLDKDKQISENKPEDVTIKTQKDNEVIATKLDTNQAIADNKIIKNESKQEDTSKSVIDETNDTVVEFSKASAKVIQTTNEKTIEYSALAEMFPFPRMRITKQNYVAPDVDMHASNGTFLVPEGIGVYRLNLQLFKEGQGYSRDQFFTALYRRNAHKFGRVGPMFPLKDTELVIPTKEQILLEVDGVYSIYLNVKGAYLSAENLPPLKITEKERKVYIDALKQYQTFCKEVEEKRQDYLKKNNLKVVR